MDGQVSTPSPSTDHLPDPEKRGGGRPAPRCFQKAHMAPEPREALTTTYLDLSALIPLFLQKAGEHGSPSRWFLSSKRRKGQLGRS